MNITIAEGNPAATEMGLALSDLARASNTLNQSVTYEGLTIDNPSDGTFAGAELLASGDIDGDALPDAVISGADGSWLVIRDVGGIFELNQSNVSGLRPVGDFSGDGLVDLAASVLEPTASIEAGTGNNVHAVTHVYLGDDMAELLARLTASTPNPQLAFEMPDAIFQPESSASSPRTAVPLFGTFGDINGDSRGDLGLYSPLRNSLHVVFGGELTPVAGGRFGYPAATY